MKSRTCAVALLVLGVLGGACSEDDAGGTPPKASGVSVVTRGALKVCMYPGFAPFAVRDPEGAWSGWDVAYLEGFAKRQNLRFEPIEIADFTGVWNEPGKDVCDIAAGGISDTAQRRVESGTKGLWSDHYYRVVRSFAVRAADAGKLTSLEDLRGKTVIVTGNSTAELDLQNRMKLAGITDVTFETTTDETAAAIRVRDGQGAGAPFAYGGGLGSIELLVKEVQGLVVAWPHCNMLADGREVDEPFSLVVRAASTGVPEALQEWIARPDAPYAGGSGPALQCPAL